MLGAIIGGVLGLAGASMQSRAASRAARSQRKAARDQIAYSEDTRDIILDRMDPFYKPGVAATNVLAYEYGLGERPEGYAGFQATPGYQFMQDEGAKAVSGMAAANGMLNSGRTMQALQDRRMGIANTEYSNHLARLSGMAGSGQNAAAGGATALTNNNQVVGNALGSIGNANAAGHIAQGNAWSNAINNGIGLYSYQNALNSGGGGFGGITIGGPGSLWGKGLV